MKANLFYLGHASIRIQTSTGKVIYIDPYAGEDYSLEADIVLVTHDHFDHNAVDKVLKKQNCKIITAKEALVNTEYKTFEVDGIKIEAVQAYNKNHHIDKCVGYIISFDNLSIYHGGDTSTTQQMSEMSDIKLDYALLPTDGKYNMDVNEASQCAKIIGARHSIPIHMSPQGFVEEIAQSFEAEGKIVVKPGHSIILD